jgi:hypothetical protein
LGDVEQQVGNAQPTRKTQSKKRNASAIDGEQGQQLLKRPAGNESNTKGRGTAKAAMQRVLAGSSGGEAIASNAEVVVSDEEEQPEKVDYDKSRFFHRLRKSNALPKELLDNYELASKKVNSRELCSKLINSAIVKKGRAYAIELKNKKYQDVADLSQEDLECH